MGRFAGWFINFQTLPNIVPTFHSSAGCFYNILHIAELIFSCSLVFSMEEVSVGLCADNPVTSSPLLVPFARLLVFKEYSVTNFKIRWGAVFCVLCVLEPIFIQTFLIYGKCRVV